MGPIYDNPPEVPAESKCLKSKICFHFKHLDVDLDREIGKMIEQGVDLYVLEGLI